MSKPAGRVLLPTLFLCAGLLAGHAASGASDGMVRRVSVKVDGGQARRPSGFGVVSNHRRFVAFVSDASKLVEGDTNGVTDVFVYDRRSQTTERVTVASDGDQMVGPWGAENTHIDISGDGRYVAFSTVSPGLVADDTGSHNDVFVHDRQTGDTIRASVDSNGIQGDGDSFEPTISGNGRYVGFQSVASNLSDVPLPSDPQTIVRSYVHDRRTETTSLVSVSSEGAVANDHTASVSLSSKGRYAAFDSGATNLTSADPNSTHDVFVRDLLSGRTRYVSKSSKERSGNDGSFEPSISGDGRFVAFGSSASNLVRHDDNEAIDVFVRDRRRGVTKRVSVGSRGQQGNGMSFGAEVAARAPVVTFVSRSTNFAGGTSSDDVYRHNWRATRTRLVSSSKNGGEANDHSIRPHVSGDGRVITFTSTASDLVERDTNHVSDQFVWRRR